ncbi:MAG: hypothetical protein H6737_08170 [Alphaproteobacteria bacterium]|nr:hypothetical protein [Alphaproteobacteria bacterium]
MFRTLLTAVLLAAPTFAHATTGLEWKWSEGQQRRYVINSQTQVSEQFWIKAQDNLDRRILEWKLNIVTTCTATEPIGKTAWSVSCTIDDIAFAVLPNRGDDDEKVVQILDEYDEKITGARVVMKMSSDGRVETIDLEDVKHTRSNDRTRQVQETMRLMLVRAFAGLELQLPKKGDDKGKPWPVRDPLIMDFPSLKGTTGGLEVNAQVSREGSSKVVVEAGGNGTRGPAIFDQQDRIANLWDMKVFTRSTFDTEHGELVKSELLAEGTITPSSRLASGTNVSPYVQALKVEHVALDATLDPLPANEMIER